MKFYLKIIIVIAVAAGGAFVAYHNGNCSSPGYEEYASEDAEINIMMEYISGWRYQEHRGSNGRYAQVQFYGTVKDGFAPSIIVAVERSSKVTFEPLTIEAMADDLVNKRAKFEDAEVLSRSESTLLGLPAVDITLAYKQPDQLRSIEFNLIPFQERVIIFKKDDRFYTLRYVNPQEEYKTYEEAFLHCVGTLSIKE